MIQDAETGVATLLMDGVSPEMLEGDLFARFTNIDGIVMQQSIDSMAMGDSSVITSSLERIDLSGGLVVGTSFVDGTEAILMNAGE